MASKTFTPPICFCGSETEYKDSAELYHGRSYGMRWICKRFPDCRGSVGAHPDGRPLGTVPNPEDKVWRGRLHALIDPLWRNPSPTDDRRKKYRRGSVYRWLSIITNLPIDEVHVGMWDAEMCQKVLKLIEQYPYEQRYELIPYYIERKDKMEANRYERTRRSN